MGFSFDDLCQAAVDMSFDERIATGKVAANDIYDYLKKVLKIPNTVKFDAVAFTLLTSLRDLVAADGVLDDDEYVFIKTVIGFNGNKQEMFDLFNSDVCGINMENLYTVIRSAPDEIRGNYVKLGLALCSADRVLKSDEIRAIYNYIN